MQSTRDVCVRIRSATIGAYSPADQPAPIVKAESRVIFLSLDRGAMQNALR